jgi:hypothetical protein
MDINNQLALNKGCNFIIREFSRTSNNIIKGLNKDSKDKCTRFNLANMNIHLELPKLFRQMDILQVNKDKFLQFSKGIPLSSINNQEINSLLVFNKHNFFQNRENRLYRCNIQQLGYKRKFPNHFNQAHKQACLSLCINLIRK